VDHQPPNHHRSLATHIAINYSIRIYRQSLVELKTLSSLGATPEKGLGEWKATGERERFTPVTRAAKNTMIEAELGRMHEHAAKTGETVESFHLK